MGGKKSDKKLIVNGKRTDGRTFDEMRPLKMEVGVLERADGSAYLEWGNNKVYAGVFGPRDCPRYISSPYRAIVRVHYCMSPFASKQERMRPGPGRRSMELSEVIKNVFENVLLLEKFPNTAIDIHVEIIQADGGTRCSAINAVALALVDAGLPMKDLVQAVSIGKIEGKLALDLNGDEDNFGSADMPVTLANRNGDILLLQMDGMLTKNEISESMEKITTSCKEIYKIQREALLKRYEV
jgi:exosome complex component RRP41